MSGQAWFGVALAACLFVLLVFGADALDRRERREERAAARSSRQAAARSSLPRDRAIGFALHDAEKDEPVLIDLDLMGHRKPRGQSLEEWIDDVLGPRPEGQE